MEFYLDIITLEFIKDTIELQMQNKVQYYSLELMSIIIIINMYYIVSGSIEIPTVLHNTSKLN